jgi:hypothetical protein
MGETQPTECSIIRKLNRSKFGNMSYLLATQYDEILYQSIGLDTQQTAHFFRSKYLDNREHNPDFSIELADAIQRLMSRYQDKCNAHRMYTKDENGNLVSVDRNVSIPANYILPVSNSNPIDGRRIDTNTLEVLVNAWKQYEEQTKIGKAENEQDSNENNTSTAGRLKVKWKGNAAQFGQLIIELIGKGYIEKPTSSYLKDANFWLSVFDMNTGADNLANQLNENKNTISGKDAGKLNLPHIAKLTGNKGNSENEERTVGE